MATTGSDNNSGTLSAPVKTLNRAVFLTRGNGTVVIRGGLYRDGYLSSDGSTYGIANQPITLQAYPHEQVWFDGTDIIAGNRWTSDGAGHWSMPWSTPGFCFNQYYTYKYDAQPAFGPCSHSDMYADPSNLAAGDPQMAFIDGIYVHEVKTLGEATPGNFFYDWSARRMYIATDPNAHQVELASRPVMLVMGGANTTNVKILGIGVRRFATNENSNQTTAAITIYGSNHLVENSVFTQMAAGGLYIGSQGSIVRNSQFINNGYDGIQSNGSYSKGTGIRDNLMIDSNVVSGNNTEKFGTNCTFACGQGGVKIAHMNGFTAKNNVFDSNYGHGFWCDLACSNGVIVNNVSKNNQRSGIIYEASDTGIIASNLVYGNQKIGIWLGSANTKVYNNTLINNGGYGDIWIYDDPRATGVGGWTDVGPDTRNIQMANNIIFSNNPTSLAQFDKGYPVTQTNPEQFFSLLDYNSYFRSRGAGQTIIQWRSITQNVNFTSLLSFTNALGYESHGQDIAVGADPFFVNLAAGDYRVRPGSVAYNSGKPLPADVAAVLGLSTGQVLSRGAMAWAGGVTATPVPTTTLTPGPTPTKTPTPTPMHNNADLNFDAKVNIFDLSILLSGWGKSGVGDIDKNGTVNIFDLSRMLSSWTG